MVTFFLNARFLLDSIIPIMIAWLNRKPQINSADMIKFQDVKFPDFIDSAIGNQLKADVDQLIQRSQDENWPDEAAKRLVTLTIRKAIAADKLAQLARQKESALLRVQRTEAARRRALDNKRKIIAGAVVLGMLDDTTWRVPLMQLLDQKVTRPADRSLFGL